MTQTPQVVLIDSGWPATFYFADFLTREKFHVRLISTFDYQTYGYHTTCVASFTSPDYAEAIKRADADPATKAILPLTEEALMQACALLPDSNKLLPNPQPWQVRLLQSKHAMAEFMQEAGLAVPEFIRVSHLSEAQSQASTWGYPVVVKGSGGVGGNQVAVCQNRQQLSDNYHRFCQYPLALQRYIQGPTWLVGGFFNQGQPLAIHCCEKLQLSPPLKGVSIEVRHQQPEALMDAFYRSFRALNWTGYASADFICDRHGQFYFLEINPRPWGAITAALAAGIEILTPLAQTLNDQPVEVHTDNRNGWRGYVFPTYLLRQQSLTGFILGLCDRRLWRGVPKTSISALTYFIKCLYWRHKKR